MIFGAQNMAEEWDEFEGIPKCICLTCSFASETYVKMICSKRELAQHSWPVPYRQLEAFLFSSQGQKSTRLHIEG